MSTQDQFSSSLPHSPNPRPLPMRSFSQVGDEPVNASNGANQNGNAQRMALRRGTSQPPGSYVDRERERERGGVNEVDVWSSGTGLSSSLRGGSRVPGVGGGGAGVIGGSRFGFDAGGAAALKSRWSGVLDEGGPQSRSSSFSAGENRMGSSHENAPGYRDYSNYGSYKSNSPFPTFSETSSPTSSPPQPTNVLSGTAHSPPRAPANVSRSRSQSLAVGSRPHLGGTTGLIPLPLSGIKDPRPSPLGRVTNPWGETTTGYTDPLIMNPLAPDVSNMSPFARDLQSILADEVSRGPKRQTLRGFQPEGEHLTGKDLAGGRWGDGYVPVSASNAMQHSKLSSSVMAALGEAHAGNGNGHDEMYNGGLSGTSSRRHSVSVVGGPNARRGFNVPGLGFSDSLHSPSERDSLYGLSSAKSFGMTPGSYSRTMGSGFSDDDLLADGFDAALKFNEPEQRADPWGTSPHSQGSRPTAIRSGSTPRTATSMDRSQEQERRTGMEREASADRMGRSGYGEKRESRFEFGRSGSWKNEDTLGQSLGSGSVTARPSAYSSYTDTAPPPSSGLRAPPATRADSFTSRPQEFSPAFRQTNFSLPPQPSGYSMDRGGDSNRFGYTPAINGRTDYSQRGPGGFPSFTGQNAPVGGPVLRGDRFGSSGHQSAAPSFIGAVGTGLMGGHPYEGNFADLGKGVPLTMISPQTRLYIVEFKAGRTDLYYVDRPDLRIAVGDLVIVEADRGQDLGRVCNDTITLDEVKAFQSQRQRELAQITQGSKFIKATGPLAGLEIGMGLMSGDGGEGPNPAVVRSLSKEIMPKRIFGLAGPADKQLLATKSEDEAQALACCQMKVRQKRLPMEVVDAEYQWDRKRLCFYYVSDKRIDFRELVRELFRLYKVRIWMSAL